MSEPVRADGDAWDLMGQLVAANVREAAWVSNRIEDGLRAQLKHLARDYAQLYDGVARIPDMQRTVHLERLLARGALAREEAQRMLDGDAS